MFMHYGTGKFQIKTLRLQKRRKALFMQRTKMVILIAHRGTH
jgi:hypothetical protein